MKLLQSFSYKRSSVSDLVQSTSYCSLYTAPNDFSSLNEVVTFLPANGSQSICNLVTVVDDIVLEGEETFFVSLEATDARVMLTVENSRASVVISDNDDGMFLFAASPRSEYDRHYFNFYYYDRNLPNPCTSRALGVLVAGLEQSQYGVNENEVNVRVCAVKFADIKLDVTVTFSTASQSAICKNWCSYIQLCLNIMTVEFYSNFSVSVESDFAAQPASHTFLSGQTQQTLCFNISIIADLRLENNEVFSVELTADSGINIIPTSASVTIINNDSQQYL